MPIAPPRLDDRAFHDLVEELIARVSAHTPEWKYARVGDPGRTLLELFAFLADTILYRANLIPERQRLVFLRLLGVGMRPAQAATSVVSVLLDEDDGPRAVKAAPIQALARIKGPAPFETRSELVVLPVTAEAYAKRPLSDDERAAMADTLEGLRRVYKLDPGKSPAYYRTTPVFPGGAADPDGFDLIDGTVDRCLWLALLAPKAELVKDARKALGAAEGGGPQILNVGVAPAIAMPAWNDEIGPRGKIPHVWEISGPDVDGAPRYHELSLLDDTTAGLTRPGVLRLVLPSTAYIDAPAPPGDDAKALIRAGRGDRPPRLDDPKLAARVVAWIRLRPKERLERLALSWVGVNAVEIDQRQTVRGRVVGTSDGSPGQVMSLHAGSVERASLAVEVEEPGRGYVPWTLIDHLAFAGRDAPVFELDAEAGTITFGDGVRGRVPGQGMRVRAALLRAGGGAAGNLPAGTLKEISASAIGGGPPAGRLKLAQRLPTAGGQDAETLAEAERRIPSVWRHGERAVTGDDYRRLAAEAPGVEAGRVEVLPRFKPHRREPELTGLAATGAKAGARPRLGPNEVPGVVSVMALPLKSAQRPPNPRADRPFLERIHAHLDARRPLATELYVIGCEYVPLAAGVGLTVRDGFGEATVSAAVRDELFRYLWPLLPGGPSGAGWPLGKVVRDRELEAVVARVSGVDTVAGVSLFEVVEPPGKSALLQRTGLLQATVTRTAPRGGVVLGRVAVPRAEVPRDLSPAARVGAQATAVWKLIKPASAGAQTQIELERWQLPELLGVVVRTDGVVPDSAEGLPNPYADGEGGDGEGGDGRGGGGVAVPVVPEVC